MRGGAPTNHNVGMAKINIGCRPNCRLPKVQRSRPLVHQAAATDMVRHSLKAEPDWLSSSSGIAIQRLPPAGGGRAIDRLLDLQVAQIRRAGVLERRAVP